MPLKSLGGSADTIQAGPETFRPQSAVQGDARFNTTTEDFEVWEGTRWVSMRPPVQGPVTDTDRTLGLALGRGVHDPAQILEAHLGAGLGFDGQGRIEAQGNGDIIVMHQPVIESVTPSFASSQLTIGEVSSTLPETKTLVFEIPESCNGALIWAAYKIKARPHPQPVYPNSEVTVVKANCNWKATTSGRNVSFPSAEATDVIGSECGTTVAHVPWLDGSGNENYGYSWWSLKIEEMEFDKGNSDISFTFSLTAARNTSHIIYNVIRCAILPYDRIHL